MAHTQQAQNLVTALIAHNKTITTAESCTGGLVSGAITDIAGASAVFTHGFITYSNQAKYDIIGVSVDTLRTYGAVSEHTAQEMAKGALHKANADIAIACTGIAGPDGGTQEKPVGLVYIAIAIKNSDTHVYKKLYGNIGRVQVRNNIVNDAMQLACTLLTL